MAAVGESGVAATYEELRARLSGKRDEADALRSQIRHMKLEAQNSRLQLQAIGVTERLVPGDMKAGSSGPSLQHREFRSLLEWLVESTDLAKQVVFECGGEEVMVGGRRVQLKRMATWPINLGRAASGMQLSVPLDLQAEIVGLLARARTQGSVSEQDVQNLVDTWEIVGTEMASPATGRQEPAIFLVHTKLSQAVVIAKWPSIDLALNQRTFDPAAHFSRLASAKARAVPAPTAPPPERKTAVKAVPPPAQPAQPAQPAPPATVPVHAGDRVLVEYAGRWFSGILQWVDSATQVAKVQCDVDSPGVITVAPLTSVFPIRIVAPPEPEPPKEPAKPPSRHMRSKTVG